jgi:hypothetical protein
MEAKVQYYLDIIEAMGDPDLDLFAVSNENALDIISLFISRCSLSDFERLKDIEYELSQSESHETP